MIRKLLYLFIICSSFLGCKKFEDGGNSFRAKGKLLHPKSSWIIKSYNVSGIEHPEFTDMNDQTNSLVTFSKQQETGHIIMAHTPYRYQISITGDRFEINGSEVNCECYYTKCDPRIFAPESTLVKWKIERLAKNELVLKCKIQETYIIKLNRSE